MHVENYTTELIEKNGIFFAKKEEQVSYPENGNEICFQLEEESFWFKHRNDCIVEAVLKYCPKNVFFDIGGGNGFVSERLQKSGIPTVLVEPGIQGCINAKKRNVQPVICSTLDNASFNKNTLPSIGLFDVVEHIENDASFLSQAFTLLRDDGYIFISVPAFMALWSDEDVKAGHFRRYRTQDLENVLTRLGFTIEYSTYIFSVLPVAVFLFRVIPTKMGLIRKPGSLNEHKKDHRARKGIVNFLLERLWRYEVKSIKRGRRIPIGGSCFVVARKPSALVQVLNSGK